MNGGKPEMRSYKHLEKAPGGVVALPSKCDNIQVGVGDLLHYVTWGGGGWGDPLERDAELVGLEIRRGLVSVKGARVYGVVADEAGGVDAEATTALRSDLRAHRNALEVFDRGPPLETLRETCEAETGLPPPRPPVWRSLSRAMRMAAE